MRFPVLKHLAWSALIAGQLGCSAAALAERTDPNEWLNRMAAAVQQTSYEGTVIRIRHGQAEALKVVHTISAGVVHEKVVSQEGDGLEIIRKGNEVHCILPDSRSVLVEEWDDRSTLFSTLPSSEVRFGSSPGNLTQSGSFSTHPRALRVPKSSMRSKSVTRLWMFGSQARTTR